jgi:hypothetical protein
MRKNRGLPSAPPGFPEIIIYKDLAREPIKKLAAI